MEPGPWLIGIAWLALGVAVACALEITADIRVRGYRQSMPVMEWVWPVTALYLGARWATSWRRPSSSPSA